MSYTPSPTPSNWASTPPQAMMPMQEQQVKTYKGKHLERDFAKDARRMARDGWSAGAPTYGGQQKIGVIRFWLLMGWRAGRKPAYCTVVYTRPMGYARKR